MRLFPRSLLWLFVSGLACGAPAELDQSLFPSPNETGYADAPIGGSSGIGVGGQSPAAQGGRSSATGGSGNASQGGSMQVGTGGAGMSLGGSSSAMGGGSQSGGTGGQAQSGAGGSGNAQGGCPDDITLLFKRPGSAGGCEGGGCHQPGGSRPDLVSPNVEDRLLNVASSCKSRPYIGSDDSFLAEKISVAGPDCGGASMPFLTPQALSSEDEQCILDWIEEVASGG
jgi:hypothetical protein